VAQNSQFFTVKSYFIIVSIITIFWLGLFVRGQTQWLQYIQEAVGLTAELKARENSFYNSRIDPIFEKYCAGCHNDNKQKGQLRLDSFRQLNFSGKSAADLTQVESNLLIARMNLPAEDRLAMPPYGRDRHSQSDIELIELWLSKGASGELTEADFPDAPAKAKEIKFAKLDKLKIKQARAPLAEKVLVLQQKYPHVLHYQARTSAQLILESFALRTGFDDQVLEEFASVKSALVELDISHTQVTDKSIDLILTMFELTHINLQGSQISSDKIELLTTLPKLQKVIANQAQLSHEVSATFAQRSIQLIATE
jgi:hypothetical protein